VAQEFHIDVPGTRGVTGLAYPPTDSEALPVTVVLAHGAGAGQASPWMVRFASDLARRGLSVATFNFLYAEIGRRVPDRPEALEACYRAAIAAVRQREPASNALVIGGKSLGGRVASLIAASDHGLPLSGLVFLGYPLHPPGRPDQLRTRHWPRVVVPTLFLQGTRDAFGTPAELRAHARTLGAPATIVDVEGGDHSFRVPAVWPVAQQKVHALAQDALLEWVSALIPERTR
jgi:hypothetical protein